MQTILCPIVDIPKRQLLDWTTHFFCFKTLTLFHSHLSQNPNFSLRISMDSNDFESSSAVVATEDVVDALLDHLVEPFLPRRDHPPPHLSLQQSVAQQMHAVVLLYNYYHRKQFPKLDFLDFDSFCKVAINAKPRLVAFVKVKKKGSLELDGQLSITEKAIMDACNICKRLNPEDSASCMEEGWTVSKVAVFLIDSKKENCVLPFSATTQGVWSLIEKTCECLLEEKKTREKKSACKRSLADEACLQQLAISAVKEKTGNHPTDLQFLESHTVYSLSEEKKAARFYIMRCKTSIKEDIVLVPIEDAINSLQGPLVTRSGNDCIVTPVVEYFHLLPYAGIFEDWLSRKMLSNGSEILHEEQGNVSMDSLPKTSEALPIAGTENFNGSKKSNQNASTKRSKNSPGKIKEKENNNVYLSSSVDVCVHHDQGEGKSSRVDNSSEERKTSSNTCVVGNADKNSPIECNHSSRKGGFIDKAEVVGSGNDLGNNECTDVKATGVNDIRVTGSSCHKQTLATEYDIVAFKTTSQKLDKVQDGMASKRHGLFKAALTVLLKKRNKLTHRQRDLDDEIARCEKNLQAVLSGGEDDLILGIDSIIEACTVACSRDATETYEVQLQFQEQSPKCMKRRRLSEAILQLRNPIQELDDICCENNWILPRYNLFPCDGGYNAKATLQGLDFECAGAGDIQPDPVAARESCAAQILIKLRNMAHDQKLLLPKN